MITAAGGFTSIQRCVWGEVMKKIMSKIKSKLNLVFLFGVGFIFAGCMTIFSAWYDLYQVTTAPYKEIVDCDIEFKRTKSELPDHEELDPVWSIRTYYLTEELVEVNGTSFIYEGEYTEDPVGSVRHTVISNDGVHWEVNDTDMRDAIICTIPGIAIMIGGILVILKFA